MINVLESTSIQQDDDDDFGVHHLTQPIKIDAAKKRRAHISDDDDIDESDNDEGKYITHTHAHTQTY